MLTPQPQILAEAGPVPGAQGRCGDWTGKLLAKRLRVKIQQLGVTSSQKNMKRGKECSTVSKNPSVTEKARWTRSCQWLLIAKLMANKWAFKSTQVWPEGRLD